jgi:zinc protease
VCGLSASVLAAAVAVGSAQTPTAGHETSAASVASYRLSQPMPVDPEVVVGTLANGLRYYVRANRKPGQRAELRLVVNAGSALEDDDQLGLAHFVEHMEFEGTRHFPRQGIVDFLSSLGLSIGPDANAATSYDDTQYTLRVPTDVPGVLDRALLVLEDWARDASFDQSGIDHERGIVLSEWRMHLGAG